MMKRHLQDYSFKSMLRRGDSRAPEAAKPLESRANALTSAYLSGLRSVQGENTGAPADRRGAAHVPPLQMTSLKPILSSISGSQSARAPAVALRNSGSQQPAAATARTHGSSSVRDHQSHHSQLMRLNAGASQSSSILLSLHDKVSNTKLPRPRLPLLHARHASGNAQERRPLWAMAPSIPKLFASLVANRADTCTAAVNERLQDEDAQRSDSGISGQGGASGRIGLEHWMEFCRETDAFSKLHVAPSDCIFAFRRGVQAAGADDSALARKMGLVMNLEAFCGCIVILAELAGALRIDAGQAAGDGALHSVWDCDPDTSRACSLILLKLLTVSPGMVLPKDPPFFPKPPVAALAPISAAAPSQPVPDGRSPRCHAPLLPPSSSSPRRGTRLLSPRKHTNPFPPQLPPSRKSSFAFTDDIDSSEVSSPSKSKAASSFKSSALTASPPSTMRHIRARRKRPDNFLPSTTHHIVDIATGSEFLRWFENKLSQVGSDGLVHPVRIVAMQVSVGIAALHACRLTRAAAQSTGRTGAQGPEHSSGSKWQTGRRYQFRQPKCSGYILSAAAAGRQLVRRASGVCRLNIEFNTMRHMFNNAQLIAP
jgi:hypothetical protein